MLQYIIPAVAVWFYRDDILIAVKGKRLAVLGERAVGKTHLVKFLTTGLIPNETQQTGFLEKTSKNRLRIKELDLKVKANYDVSGDKAVYGQWKDLYCQADLVLYLVRADKLIAGDFATAKRIEYDLEQMSKWKESNQPKKLFIVGTHCDLDENFKKFKRGTYLDKFNEIGIVKRFVRQHGPSNTKVVLGSMKTQNDTQELVFNIFKQAIP